MLKTILGAILIASCTVQSQSNVVQLQQENVSVTGKKGIAVLELFTSEGCSSCPAADKLAVQLKESYKGDLVVLEFHVDYWDRLGWKDPFSKAAFSQRQREYGERFNLESIYTPQAVVNGTGETVGSDERNLKRLIDRAISTGDDSKLSVTASENADKKSIKLNFKYTGTNDAAINFALVQKHAATQVQAGENEGRKLAHTNIVRNFTTVSTNRNETSLLIPTDISKSETMIIAYAQEKENGKISSVALIENW